MVSEEMTNDHKRTTQNIKRPAAQTKDNFSLLNPDATSLKTGPFIDVSVAESSRPRAIKRPHLARFSFSTQNNENQRNKEILNKNVISFQTLNNIPTTLEAEMHLNITKELYVQNLKRFGQDSFANKCLDKILDSNLDLDIKAKDLIFVKTLGQGAYGVVEELRDSQTRFTLAVKRLALTLTGSCDMMPSALSAERKRLLMDLRINAKSQCPYVVEFYGAMLSEGDVWICMEVMDCSLDELYKTARKLNQNQTGVELKEPALPEFVIRKITLCVILALSYLREELNVIHRDVKPSNVLLARDPSSCGGTVKICDFGISGTLINSLAKTIDVGCQPYMAPERIDPQLVRSKAGYGYKSDVWSLGITLVEVVAGKFPYPTWKTPFDQLKSVLEDDPPSIPACMGVSEDLKNFVATCLTKEYAKRPGYTELLAHPFLQGYQPEEIDIGGYVEKMLQQISP